MVAAQCEPTLTCESYGFAVYQKPKEDSRIVDPGALIRRFLCCLQPLFERVATLPDNSTTNVLDKWLKDHVAAIREFLVTEGLYDCDVAAQLSAVAVPPTSFEKAKYLVAWNSSVRQALTIIASVLQKCLCAALLPPCPPPELNDCVPIATVKVTRGNCRVTHICNISNRRFLITWPSVQYWLSWLPFLTSWGGRTPTVRDRIEQYCCTPVAEKFDAVAIKDTDLRSQPAAGLTGGLRLSLSVGRGAGAAAGAASTASHPFTELLLESLAGGPEANPVSLLLAAMGARASDGSELASETALQYPGQAMLLHQVVGPAIESLLPTGIGATVPRSDATKLTQEIEALRKTVDDHKRKIKALEDLQ